MSANARSRSRVTLCSFCRNEGHNITNCNDERLNEFENLLNQKKDECNGSIREFNVWLLSEEVEYRLIKAFAVRKCGGVSRDNLQTCCDNIADYIWGEGYEEVNNNAWIEYDMLNFLHDISENNVDMERLNLILSENGMIDPLTNSVSSLFMLSLISTIRQEQQLYDNELNNRNKIVVDLDTHSVCIGNEDCSICYEPIERKNFVKLDCNHSFCKGCIQSIAVNCHQNYTTHKCAMCRNNVKQMTAYDVKVKEEIIEYLNA